ncbi:BlaI/MecI/CopY family transcriptional regulator [Terriglobus sp. TAA 43]|uniref:BlaI/MecI/CopY family transcriptional regulator n=1 Tax=Terriglobus sp. TAA 43 TaxID=278961 RepID=UPI000646C2DD|nr:BlaI/MecI/CopY family transcriptional regulator [Terriglobus sp. TAA 43]
MIGRRKGSSSLTQMELQFMDVLWRQKKKSSSVQQVQDALLEDGVELAYTTVQTVLNTLEKKGKVSRKLDGRAFVYLPAITKESILKQAVRELADRMFGGSSEDLVMSLITAREVDAKRIAKLARAVADKDGDK